MEVVLADGYRYAMVHSRISRSKTPLGMGAVERHQSNNVQENRQLPRVMKLGGLRSIGDFQSCLV